jgi:hypothetical protein
MRVVESVLDTEDPDERLASGAEICLGYALDILQQIQVGLPGEVMGAEVASTPSQQARRRRK